MANHEQDMSHEAPQGPSHQMDAFKNLKEKLTERDLLKVCMEKPQYLSKALGHADASTGLETVEQKKEFLKYMYRAWSGTTKYLYQQVVNNKKCVDFPLVGRFYLRQKVDEDEETGKQSNCVCFIPHLDFIESGKFAFPQNDKNISPLSNKVPKVEAMKMSLGAISVACEYDRDIVVSILKDVMVSFVS